MPPLTNDLPSAPEPTVDTVWCITGHGDIELYRDPDAALTRMMELNDDADAMIRCFQSVDGDDFCEVTA